MVLVLLFLCTARSYTESFDVRKKYAKIVRALSLLIETIELKKMVGLNIPPCLKSITHQRNFL